MNDKIKNYLTENAHKFYTDNGFGMMLNSVELRNYLKANGIVDEDTVREAARVVLMAGVEYAD